MEIKRIGGIISTYQTAKAQSPKKIGAAAPAKNNTDRIEFGFEAALTAAKAAVAADIRADAAPQELLDGKNTAEQGVEPSVLASYILMG